MRSADKLFVISADTDTETDKGFFVSAKPIYRPIPIPIFYRPYTIHNAGLNWKSGLEKCGQDRNYLSYAMSPKIHG